MLDVLRLMTMNDDVIGRLLHGVKMSLISSLMLLNWLLCLILV